MALVGEGTEENISWFARIAAARHFGYILPAGTPEGVELQFAQRGRRC